MDVYETIKIIRSNCDNYMDPDLVSTIIDDNHFMGKNNITEIEGYGISPEDAYEDRFMKILKEENCPFDKYPDIPWVAAYDMRNFISHEYANIDEEIIYDVIKNELPTLLIAVNDILLKV